MGARTWRRARALAATLLTTTVLLLAAPAASHAVTVSGTIKVDQAGAAWTGCDNVTPNVSVWYDSGAGGTQVDGTCAPGGTYSIPIAMGSLDQVVVVFLNGVADDGVAYSRNNVTGAGAMTVDLTVARVRIRSDTATVITNTHINRFDQTQDGDIPINSTGTASTLAGAFEVAIDTGEAWAPGGDITVPALDLRNNSTFTSTTGATETITASGSGSCNGGAGVQMPVCLGTGVTWGVAIPEHTRFTGQSDLTIPGNTWGSVDLMPAGGNPTYVLGSGGHFAFDVIGDLTVGDGVNPVNASLDIGGTQVHTVAFGTSGDIDIRANSKISGSQFTVALSIKADGDIAGAGQLDVNLAVYINITNAGVRFFGSTSGSSDWNIGSLTFQNNFGSAETVRINGGGTGMIHVYGNVAVGNSLESVSPITVDANTNDRRIDVDTRFLLHGGDTFLASSSQLLTIGLFAEMSGTFTANGGTVEFDNASRVGHLSMTTQTTFYNLVVSSPGKTLRIDADDATVVLGTFTLVGASCADRVGISSLVDGDDVTMVVSAWNVQYADVGDITAVPAFGGVAATSTNSVNLGGNSNWTFTSPCAATNTVTGTVTSDEAGTPVFPCTVRLSIAGMKSRSVACTAGGNYSFSGLSIALDDTVAVWIDGGVNRGVHYTRGPAGGSMAGLTITTNRVRVSSGSGSPVVLTDVLNADQDLDVDIPMTAGYFAYGSANSLAAAAGTELLVQAGATFDPVIQNISFASADVAGTLHLSLLSTLTLTASGTGACSGGPGTQRPFCIEAGGNLAADIASSVRYTGTGAVHVQGAAYQGLELMPAAAATWQLGASDGVPFTVGGIFTVGDGTNALTLSTSSFNPVLTQTAGIWGSGTDVRAGSSIVGTGTGTLTFDVGLSGNGTVNLTGGTVVMRPTAVDTVLGSTSGAGNWTFRRLEIRRTTAGSNTVRTASGGTGWVNVTQDLVVGSTGDAGTITFDVNTNDRAVDVDNNVSIGAGSTLSASSSQSMMIGGNFTNDGSFVANGGLVSFDDASKFSNLSYAADTAFGTLVAASPSKTLVFDNVEKTTVAVAFNVLGWACGTPVTLTSASAVDPYDIDVTGTTSVNFAHIVRSNAVTATSATNTTVGASVTGWNASTGTCASLSISLPSGVTEAMGGLLPGLDGFASTDVQVDTNNASGYQLTATDEDNAWWADCVCGGTIADWTGTSATPTAWADASNGFGGISVRNATGGRMAKWGTGGGPWPVSDMANNYFAGLDLGASVLLHQSTRSIVGTSDTIEVIHRVSPGSTTPAGAYGATIVFTATANP